MSHLVLFLLGPPRVERDGEPVEIRRRKALALLVYLAVTRQSHSRDTLATLLWPELDQSQARAGLRRALAALKKALGESFLDVDRETVNLNPDAEIWLDVNEFQDRLAQCRAHGHPGDEICPACRPLLTEAAALYRDDFLAGFALPDSLTFDEWQFFHTEGLRNELASTLERLTCVHSGQGEFERAIACARRWLVLDPLHEPAHRCLMRLYAWSGQRAAALRQYGECKRTLKEELDMSPNEETAQVYEAIKRNQELPPLALAQPSIRKHNLPVQLTPFVGREAALAEIGDRLQDRNCRLLTLVGPGGSGKTRLALEAAAAQLDQYTHGVYFVYLAPLQSVDAIVPTVANVLGLRFYADARGGAKVEPERQLLDYLSQKSMLLILDNFEHLLSPSIPPAHGGDERGAEFVTEILRAAPDVKILVTSRVRLNMQGEHLFPIAGMDFPMLMPSASADAIQYGAVQLFLTSARRAQPGFGLTVDNLAGVVRICHLVEGMPLGILLAAAWVGMLTPAEVAAEISGEIGQGLDFLETDLRDVPERQRSLRAVFDHSWRLLTEREREVLQALSVFRGGFTSEAARYVTGSSLRELMALINKSLLRRATTGRYEVHELLRQYAAERLDQVPAASEAAHDRHCAYYTSALERWAADLKGAWQQNALADMDVEIENARAAWDWAVEQEQVKRLDQAVEGLSHFYAGRGRFQEGEAACQIAANRLEATHSADGLRVLVKVLRSQYNYSLALGRTELASQLVQQGLALLERPELDDQDTRPEKASVLLGMGHSIVDSYHEEARRLYEQSLALYQALDDRWGTAEALEFLAGAAWRSGNYDEVKQLAEESLAIRRSLGDRRGIAVSLGTLGDVALVQGRLEEAEHSLRESNAIYREINYRPGIAYGLSNWGATLMRLGKFAEAHALLEESVAICNDLGNRYSLACSNMLLGGAKRHLGRYEQARVQVQKSLTLFQEIGDRLGIALSRLSLGCVALAEEAYAEAQGLLQGSAAAFREIGRQMDLGSALAALAIAARGLGQLPQARRYLCEALRMWDRILTISAVGLLLTDQGQSERAVELYALVSRYPVVANSRWFEDIAGNHIAAVAGTLPPDVVAAAQERGQAWDLGAAVAESLAELEQE